MRVAIGRRRSGELADPVHRFFTEGDRFLRDARFAQPFHVRDPSIERVNKLP